MKKIIKISALLALAATVLASCVKDAELDTNQYSNDKVTLVSFGPNPVMRGGTLTFIGSNLEKVTQVQIPGLDPISTIEVVTPGPQSEIRVQLPVEGAEVGVVKLLAGNTELVTKSDLTYIEPIVFDDFSPKNALPGDIITIKGDYMNLVTKVEFTGGAVAEVEPIDRHNAKVTVPATAITGIIIVADDNEIPNRIYSEEELVIGDPEVNSITALWKKGETVTIAGEHLEMIEKVVFVGATIAAEDFTLASDGKKVSFELPATAADGDVVAISYAGKEFGKTAITMVVPTELEAAPQPVKAGSTMTITGKDLDLVSTIDFDGAVAVGFEYASNNITLTVPATAKEGDVTLKMDNGASVATPFTLVSPTITSVSPLELYAGDDELIVVKGTELDLVASATLGGKEVEIATQSESEISLKTSVSSVGGKVCFSLANGTVIESAETITLNYHALVIVNERPNAQHIGQEVVLKGENLNLVETIYIGEAKVTQYSIRTDNEVRFLMPWNKVGSYQMSFHLYNGDVEVQANPIEVLLEQTITTIWEGEDKIGGWDHGFQALSWGGYDWSQVKAGTQLIVYFTPYVGDYDSQIRFGNGSWVALPSTAGYGADGNLILSQDVSYNIITLTDADLNELQNNGGLVLFGAWYTVNKVVLAADIPQEKAIWTGSEHLAWSGMTTLSWGGYDWSSVKVGTVLTAYFTLDADQEYWQVRFANGSWNALPSTAGLATDGNIPMNLGDTHYSVTLTAEDIDQLVNAGGLVMTGTNYTLTSLTLL